MPELLHEYWEDDENGGSFGPVLEDNERRRPAIFPNARLVFSVWARSWEDAMQARNDKLGWGLYVPVEGVANHVYSDKEAAIQQEFLSRRDGTAS